MELLKDAHFWVGVAFIVFLGILVYAGVHSLAWKHLGEAGDKVRAQLDEANRLREEAQALLARIQADREASEKQSAEKLKKLKKLEISNLSSDYLIGLNPDAILELEKMAQGCGTNKIKNPKTGICVKIDGAIGKNLLALLKAKYPNINQSQTKLKSKQQEEAKSS